MNHFIYDEDYHNPYDFHHFPKFKYLFKLIFDKVRNIFVKKKIKESPYPKGHLLHPNTINEQALKLFETSLKNVPTLSIRRPARFNEIVNDK